MKRAPTTAHNYEGKMLALGQQVIAAKIKLADVDVLHDDWCDALNGRGFCNCDPVVELRRYPT